jgi:hypothetical protein
MANQFDLDLEEESSSIVINDTLIPAQGFTLATQGFQFSGVSGVWACGTSEQGYLLTYLTDSEEALSLRQTRFQEVFASFGCQE